MQAEDTKMVSAAIAAGAAAGAANATYVFSATVAVAEAAGLTGAAATSSALATLGGGAVAAGGGGMVAGITAVAAAAAWPAACVAVVGFAGYKAYKSPMVRLFASNLLAGLERTRNMAMLKNLMSGICQRSNKGPEVREREFDFGKEPFSMAKPIMDDGSAVKTFGMSDDGVWYPVELDLMGQWTTAELDGWSVRHEHEREALIGVGARLSF